MAEKRMISKVISVSEKVNGLPDIFDMLLYTWMIPHTDDFGRMTGSPAKVKSLVVPMLDKTKHDIEVALGHLQNANLIIWYEYDGDKIIQIVNFEKHQTGLHKRTKSKYPEPPEDSRKFREIPLELNRTEQNRTEEKGTEGSGQTLKFQSIINSLNLKTKGVFELEQVVSYVGVMDDELIEEALKRSERVGKVSYALGILRDWATNGYKTMADIAPKHTKVKQLIRNQKPVIPVVQNSAETRELSPDERDQMQNVIHKLGGSLKLV